MDEKSPVFQNERRARHAIRNAGKRPIAVIDALAPFAVGRSLADLREKGAVAVVNDLARRRRDEFGALTRILDEHLPATQNRRDERERGENEDAPHGCFTISTRAPTLCARSPFLYIVSTSAGGCV